MVNFIEEIAQGASYDVAQVEGYSEGDLVKIERLYDIRLTGQFRQFMTEMGRSSGGLIGDDPIILYRSTWSARGHIRRQIWLEELVKDFYFKNSPVSEGVPWPADGLFVFSIENESLFLFVATKSNNPDQVYLYNENGETLTNTKIDFLEYMKRVVRVYGNGRTGVICRGELLIV